VTKWKFSSKKMPWCGKLLNQHSPTDLSIPRAISASLLVNTLFPSQHIQSQISQFRLSFFNYPPITSSTYHISHEKDTLKMSSHLPPHSSISSKKKSVYDLTPFLSCTTITSRLLPGEAPVPLPIPETLIASPLAANLAPATLLDIRELLTGECIEGTGGGGRGRRVRGGDGIWRGAGSEKGKEKGDEVWRAWKRAWDLWNGYFVEGRVNEGFVKGEYERIKAELEVDRERIRKGEEMVLAVDDEVDANMPSSRPVWRGTPPVPKLRDAEEVVKGDGSTGGFMPMKLLPEYWAPETDEAGNYPEGWEDVLANTVWRPRRVGEREGEVSVGIDGEWGEKSEFEFDGGVDCGRSPYPVRTPFPFAYSSFVWGDLASPFEARLFRFLFVT
jgi:hypothetical protein